MKWRNIKRNPPTTSLCWALVCDKECPEDRSISAQYSKDKKEFYNIFNGIYLDLSDITHWMPLPTYNEVK